MLFAVLLFGREIPNVAFGAILALFAVVFLLLNRSGPHPVDEDGRGRMYQCARCGTHFQPNRVGHLDNGEDYEFSDDECPKCGLRLRDEAAYRHEHHQ